MNNLYVLVGRSGSGKTTLLNYAVEYYDVHEAISFTTREKRFEELDGIDYIFISSYDFMYLLAAEQLIEYVEYNGNFYGLPKSSFNLNRDNIVIVEPNGLEHLKKNEFITDNFNIITVLIEESDEVIRERLIRRGDDIQDIERRLIIDKELFKDVEYDYLINSKFFMIDKLMEGDE